MTEIECPKAPLAALFLNQGQFEMSLYRCELCSFSMKQTFFFTRGAAEGSLLPVIFIKLAIFPLSICS